MRKQQPLPVRGKVSAALPLGADTWTDPGTGYTWTYQIKGDTATVCGTSVDDKHPIPACSPSPTGTIAIPVTLGGKSVTSIGSAAFANCTGLTGVKIPSSVTSIGGSAFKGCTGLERVVIPSGVTDILSFAFANCTGLANVTIPSGVTSIGGSAFKGCTGLSRVVIPSSVKTIRARAFKGCSRLLHAIVPMSFAGDVGNIFESCPCHLSRVESIDVGVEIVNGIGLAYTVDDGKAIVGVGADASAIDTSMSGELIIPSTLGGLPVTAIAPCAFGDCANLARVTIGSDVTSIGDHAFSSCKKLARVTFKGNAPECGNDIFADVPSGCIVSVPRNSTGWGVDIPGKWNGLAIDYTLDTVFTLTLDANGGSVSGQASVSEQVTIGKETSQAAGMRTVSRAGHMLVGWFDTSAATGGNMVFDARGFAANGVYWAGSYSPRISSAKWKCARNVTAYARWVPSSRFRVVTFDANGGTKGAASYACVVEQGKNTMQAGASGTKATRAGYVLVGWYDTSAATGGNMLFDARGYAANGVYWAGSYSPRVSSAKWKYARNVTAYARWVSSSRFKVVTLDANGGAKGAASYACVVEQGKNTMQAGAAGTKATRAGYALVGWFDTSAATGGNMLFDARGYAVNGVYWAGSYSPSVSSAKWKYARNVTAYARWVSSSRFRVVTLDANGGTIGNASYASIVVEQGKNTMQAGAAGTKVTRSGYMLVGWYDTNETSGGNMLFDAMGYAVDGKYWNGSYWPKSSSATWKYAGNVTAYARWATYTN